jgi:hypothetical protein
MNKQAIADTIFAAVVCRHCLRRVIRPFPADLPAEYRSCEQCFHCLFPDGQIVVPSSPPPPAPVP